MQIYIPFIYYQTFLDKLSVFFLTDLLTIWFTEGLWEKKHLFYQEMFGSIWKECIFARLFCLTEGMIKFIESIEIDSV